VSPAKFEDLQAQRQEARSGDPAGDAHVGAVGHVALAGVAEDVVVLRVVRPGLGAAQGVTLEDELDADENRMVLDVLAEARDAREHAVAEDAGHHEAQGGVLHLVAGLVVGGVLLVGARLVGARRSDLATSDVPVLRNSEFAPNSEFLLKSLRNHSENSEFSDRHTKLGTGS